MNIHLAIQKVLVCNCSDIYNRYLQLICCSVSNKCMERNKNSNSLIYIKNLDCLAAIPSVYNICKNDYLN